MASYAWVRRFDLLAQDVSVAGMPSELSGHEHIDPAKADDDSGVWMVAGLVQGEPRGDGPGSGARAFELVLDRKLPFDEETMVDDHPTQAAPAVPAAKETVPA